MTRVQELAWPQRIGYVLIMLLIGAGWLICLALLLEWPSAQWSRPALAFQAAALVLALLLQQRVPVRRLVVYPLVLAGSIYLWDTTLPPPSLPDGWLRVLIPSLVLLGLLIDYALKLSGYTFVFAEGGVRIVPFRTSCGAGLTRRRLSPRA